MPSKILVTGGAGFIGSNLVEELLKYETKLTILDDFSNGLQQNLNNLDVEIIQGDIRNHELVDNILSKRFDYVFHLAARGSVPRSIVDPITTHDINVNGTLNLLNSLIKYPAKLIFSSSSSVYGRNINNPKDETDWVSPLSPYAASKLSCEGLIASYSNSYNIPSLVLRFFNVYGPKQRFDIDFPAVLPKWINELSHEQPIYINGNGDISRDFTYVKDLTRILAKTIDVSFNFEIFNLINCAFGKTVSLIELASALKNLFPGSEINFGPHRLGDILDSKNNPSKLISVFGEINVTPLSEGIEETVNYYRKSPSKDS